MSESANSKSELHPNSLKFQHLLESAATKCLNFISEEDFIAYYKRIFQDFQPKDESVRPPLAGSSSEAKKLRGMIHTSVLDSLKEQIQEVISEHNFDTKFRELELMTMRASNNKEKKAWRPPGDANKHMEPYETAAMLEERNQLRLLLSQKKEELDLLKSRLMAKRASALALDKELDEKSQLVKDVISEHY